MADFMRKQVQPQKSCTSVQQWHGIHKQQFVYQHCLHKIEEQVSIIVLLKTFGKCCYFIPIDFLMEINIHIMRSDAFLTCVNAVNSWGGGGWEKTLVMEI